MPTQLLISGSDWVVHREPQHGFFVNLGTPIKERHVLPGFFHDTLGERDRAPAVAKVRALLSRSASPSPVRDAPICVMPTARASPATRPIAWPRRLPPLSPARPLLGTDALVD